MRALVISVLSAAILGAGLGCSDDETTSSASSGGGGDGGAGGGPELPLAFVSSLAVNGNLGGPLGADGNCMNLAALAGRPGEYKAYLALVSGEHPFTRFAYRGPWYDQNDRLILDTVDPQAPPDRLENALVLDERGQPITIQFNVWTGVGENPIATCGDWTQGFGQGWAGRVGAADATFDSFQVQSCNTASRLYCLRENYVP